jgi:mannosyltransferase
VAAVLRFTRLGSQSLWVDETMTWQGCGVGQPFQIADVLHNVHGPLYGVILYAWTALAGDSEWVMRLPSALFGIATVPAMARLASRWMGRETALGAAWLTACSPFLVWYGQEVRNYALLLLCTVLASSSLLEMTRVPRARTALGYLAAATAGLLSNWSFVLGLPAQLWWWWRRPEGRRARMAWLAAALVVLTLAALPFVPHVLSTWDWSRLSPGHAQTAGEPALRGPTTFHAAAVPYALFVFSVGYTLGPSLRELRADPGAATLVRHAPAILAVSAVFGVLLLLGLRAVARRRRLTDILLWTAVPVALQVWIAMSNFKVFHPRYLMVGVPAFVVVLAAGLADARGGVRRGLWAAVGAIWTLSLLHHYGDARYGKEDYRGMAALLRSRASVDERIVSMNADLALTYYYRGPLRVEPVWLGLAAKPARLDQLMAEAAGDAAGMWVVETRPEDLDPSGAFARHLEQKYPDAERFMLEGVRVWHVRFRSMGPSPGTPPAAPGS